MIITNDKKIYEKCNIFTKFMFWKNHSFNHDDMGWNYRFTNIQAAIGLGQLKNINWIVKRKKEIGRRYIKKLINNKNIIIQKNKNSYSENIFWFLVFLLKKKL